MNKPVNYYKFGNHPVIKERRNRLRMSNILLGVIVFATFFSGLFYGLKSSYFELEEIVFEGNIVFTAEELEIIFPYPLGTNIWKIDLSLLEEKYLSLPRLKKVQASRIMPDRIAIIIKEREKVALLPYQGYLYEIALDGTLMGSRLNLSSINYPLITGMSGFLYRPGENIITSSVGELLLSFLAVLREADEIELSEINVSNPSNLVVVTPDGRKAWLGRRDFAEKLRLLPEIMPFWPEEDVYLDFRVLNAPNFSFEKN